MNKKIAAAFILVSISWFIARADGGLIEFGIKGGVTTQRVNFSNTARYDGGDYLLGSSTRGGYHLGIISRINLPLVHFQPEILFNNSGYRINSVIAGESYGSKSIVRVRTVEVPVLAGMRMMWLRLQAGPMFTVLTEAKTKDRALIRDVHVTKPSVSYLIGLGLDLGRFNVDVRFNGNFSKTTQNILYDNRTMGIDYKSKNKQWMFSVGYMF